MFTFSHVTSIGISEDEYNRRLALGEKNLAKGENKFYREIATELTVPTTHEEWILYVQRQPETEDIKLGDTKHTLPLSLKLFIVGLKLAVNQKVQAANRDGNDGPSNGDVVAAVIRYAKKIEDDDLFLRACGALASAKTVKKFATAWMADHPDFEVVK